MSVTVGKLYSIDKQSITQNDTCEIFEENFIIKSCHCVDNYVLTYLLTYLLTYFLTYLLTYSMVQSPSWEPNWFAASQEIPRISWNLNVHYRTHKCPPPVSILGQSSPVHIPTSHLLEIHPNIIHPSIPRSRQWVVLKNSIKIYIKTAPTCFSITVTPNSATYRHQ